MDAAVTFLVISIGAGYGGGSDGSVTCSPPTVTYYRVDGTVREASEAEYNEWKKDKLSKDQ